MTVMPSNPDPISIDDLVTYSRLKRLRGLEPPPFISRVERDAWLEKHRHLVADEQPKPSS
jgi:hypothetical protein